MVITVVGFKGGVGKSTTCVHIAAYLQKFASTLLVDGDPNRSIIKVWDKAGKLPFKVVDANEAMMHSRDFEHIVIDTKARPDPGELQTLARGCDLLIVPSSPDQLAVDALLQTVEELQTLDAQKFRILITMVQPLPNTDGERLREALKRAELPTFDNWIPFLAAFRKSVDEGVPVYEMRDPRALRAWGAYESAFKEVVNV